MKEHRIVGAFAILLLGLCIAGIAQAQVGGTRVTPCNAATPNNALCVTWVAPTQYTNGQAIPSSVALTYRVEQRVGTAGTWATVTASTSARQAYYTNLSPGTYFYRVYTNCAGCDESPESNTAQKDATAPPPPQPGAPVITLAVVIGVDHAPVYSIVSGNRRGEEVIGFVPVGKPCTGAVVFTFRSKGYRRVSCDDVKLWGVNACRNPAAACGRADA